MSTVKPRLFLSFWDLCLLATIRPAGRKGSTVTLDGSLNLGKYGTPR